MSTVVDKKPCSVSVFERKNGQLGWLFPGEQEPKSKEKQKLQKQKEEERKERKRRQRKSIYQGRRVIEEVNDKYEVNVIRRNGSSIVSVELYHERSGYRDRVVLMDGKCVNPKITAAKKQLVTRFLIEKSMGIHVTQKYRTGDEERGED